MRATTCRGGPVRWVTALVLALALVAAACGDDDDTAAPDDAATDSVDTGDDAPTDEAPTDDGDTPPPPTPTPPPVDPEACPVDALDDASGVVEIEFWHSMSATNADVLEALVRDYNADQDRVRVRLVYQGSYGESLSKYVSALRGGQLPDLIQTEETAMQLMVDSRSTVPAQACVDAAGYDTSDYLGEVLDQYRIGGVLVTMPFQLSNLVLFYDRAAFVEAGLDPDSPPTTFDEVLEASRTLVQSGAARRAGISLQADPWILEQWIAKAGAPVVDHDNGRTARATAALLDSPAAVQAFGFLADLAAEGLVMTSSTDALAKYVAVGTRDTAMTIGSSATLGVIYDEIGRFPGVEIGVAPLPGPTEGGVTVGGGSLWMVERSPAVEKAAAWDFQVWLNEPDQQVRWAVGTGYIPSRASAGEHPDLLALWEERPGFKVAFDQLAAAPTPPGGGSPVIGDYAGVRSAIVLAMEELMSGAALEPVVQRTQERATEAIRAYNRRIGE